MTDHDKIKRHREANKLYAENRKKKERAEQKRVAGLHRQIIFGDCADVMI